MLSQSEEIFPLVVTSSPTVQHWPSRQYVSSVECGHNSPLFHHRGLPGARLHVKPLSHDIRPIYRPSSTQT